jgi:hypothetical protein
MSTDDKADKPAPIRDYEPRTPRPDEPKTDAEAREAEHHDELEGDADAA